MLPGGNNGGTAMFVWGEAEYAVFGHEAGLGGLEFSSSKPRGFPAAGRRMNRVDEEVLETMLLLHFEALFGASPVRVVCASPMSSQPDVIALDGLGRVHLVEAKKDKVKVGDFDQALQYALRYIFHDARIGLFNKQPPDPTEWLAGRICGLWSGVRSDTLGPRAAGAALAKQDRTLKTKLREHFGPLSRGSGRLWGTKTWEDFGPRKRSSATYQLAHSAARMRLKTFASQTKRRRPSFPAEEALWPLAERWAERLPIGPSARRLGEDELTFDANRPLVLWLVGPSFSGNVEEKARAYRALGMDVRLLQANVLSPPGEARWFMDVHRERFAARDDIERQLAELAASASVDTARPPRLVMRLYRVKSPSDRGEAAFGTPLVRPSAKISGLGSESITISATAGGS